VYMHPSTPTLAAEYARAQLFFDSKAYSDAALILAAIVNEEPGNAAARLLLARSYYHSAQLNRAEAELRRILARDPVEAYAHFMLGRTLQRQSRHAEAVPHLRLAAAMDADLHPGLVDDVVRAVVVDEAPGADHAAAVVRRLLPNHGALAERHLLARQQLVDRLARHAVPPAADPWLRRGLKVAHTRHPSSAPP
jgi:tetratricopeptide (TPR) repeat protein